MLAKKIEIPPVDELKNIVQNDLEKVNQQIYKLTESKKTELIPLISNHLISSGGKRIRPILTLASSNVFNYQGASHVDLATAVEYIHTSTLLHDDVIDESKTRRNKKTANVLWDNKACILVGDFLFSQAFKSMVRANSIPALDVLSTASAEIAESEVWQLQMIGDFDVTMSDYLSLINAKTATLFAASCQVGGIIAGANKEELEALKNYGTYLGIAFQMVDDILDYIGNKESFGKDAGGDLKEKKVTLPIIVIRDELSAADRLTLKNIIQKQQITDDDFSITLSILNSYNAFDKAYKYVSEYSNKGVLSLEKLPQNNVTKILKGVISSYSDRVT